MSIEEAIKNLNIMLDSAQRRTRRNIVIPDLIEAIEMAIEALKEQRPRGEWKNGICTNCGAECFEDDYMRDIKTEYCHRCGADMRRKEGEANE